MKDILTAPFVKEMCDTTANMYRLGWDERNGGNISYMLDEEEVAQYLDINHVLREIPTGFKADALIGRIFIVTGTGKYFKNVKGIPEKLIALDKLTYSPCLKAGDSWIQTILIRYFSTQRFCIPFIFKSSMQIKAYFLQISLASLN